MPMGRGRVSLGSEITIDGDLDFLTLHQVKRLASPATGEALRKGSAEILNADIHASAGILASKLGSDYEPATKEFFVKPGQKYTTATPTIKGYHQGFDFDGAGERLGFEFRIPVDFTSLTSAVLVVIANATATGRLNFYSEYAVLTESYNVHAESDLDVDTAFTNLKVTEIDISGVLGSIVAGDYVGISVLGDDTNTADICILGIKIKYA